MVTIQETNGRKVRVTFTMPAMDRCNCLYLVGDFHGWNESVYQMQRASDGTWSITLELELGQRFRYRFRTCDGEWLDDPSGSESFVSESSLIPTFATPVLS